MSITLHVLNGSRTGETLILDKTTSVGRIADVSFNDSKMSKIHAIFQLDRAAGWIVKDQDSKNGLLINGAIAETHALSEDDLVEIGTTQLRVVSVAAPWRPELNQLLIEALDVVKDVPAAIYPFKTIPALYFLQGIQAGEKHILEYGPRHIGGECEDIQLFEPHCPDFAFEISADNQGVWFTTKYPKIVLVNDNAGSRTLLKKGDRIRIHTTIIEVDFLNL